jgi:PKD repeat protein
MLKIDKLLVFLFSFLIEGGFLISQNETSKWYFGYKAGLDFNSNPPSVISNSQLFASEGCSSIADGNGNLLFYTVGDTVWNAQHQIMANGTGLFAGNSMTQASLIVKKPGATTIYYLFTLNGVIPPAQLYYSEIDMSLANGSGSVTVKNTSLQANCNEKLTATKHCNGKDVWVLVHEFNSPNFIAFLVSQNGVNPTGVVSNVPPIETSIGGQMKFSPNSKKIGLAANTNPNFNVPDKFILFDFDNSTGVVSNSLSLLSSTRTPYGCEFSKDGSVFYGTIRGYAPSAPAQLLQWNLCAGSYTAIAASIYSITLTPLAFYDAMQLAKDGKIYISNIPTTSISIIHDPENLGPSCNFSSLSFPVSPGFPKLGLPGFISSYFKPQLASFTYSSTSGVSCRTMSFSLPPILFGCSASEYQSISWEFGDPASGILNISTQANPVHVFSNGGSFPVKLFLHRLCGTDTIAQTIMIPAPTLSVSGTFTVCPHQSLTLTANGADNYIWSSGQQSSSIILSPSITSYYSVSGTNTLNGCSSTQGFYVVVDPCTGIESKAGEKPLFQISPNPFGQEFEMNIEKDAQLEVFDLQGLLIFKEIFSKGKYTIPLSICPAGFYIARITSEFNFYNYRLIKQH